MPMFDLTYHELAYDHATRLTDSTYIAIETSCVDVASQRLDLCTGYKGFKRDAHDNVLYEGHRESVATLPPVEYGI